MDKMNTSISENTKAVLLLTTFFNSNELRQYKPLTINGYGYFARWLAAYKYQPADLLDQTKLFEISNLWAQLESHEPVKQKVSLQKIDATISDITLPRLQSLLGRGASLSMALDKWNAVGIWILNRSHEYYPAKIKKQLKEQAPAIFFGIGDPKLLAQPSIGFVGSRDCQQDDLNATAHYVKNINNLGYQVVSGAAKGIDSHAMLSSLENGNTSIGIVADSLCKTSASSQWRQYLKSGQLVLITPYYPEAVFTTPNAMARNKFIYLLSSATVVVCSSDKGGTWEGAKENLKNNWVPLLVSEHKQPIQVGNQALLNGTFKITKIAMPSKAKPISLNDSTLSLTELISSHSLGLSNTKVSQAASKVQQENLFDVSAEEQVAPVVKRNYANKDEFDFANSLLSTVSTNTDSSASVANEIAAKSPPEVQSSNSVVTSTLAHSTQVLTTENNTIVCSDRNRDEGILQLPVTSENTVQQIEATEAKNEINEFKDEAQSTSLLNEQIDTTNATQDIKLTSVTWSPEQQSILAMPLVKSFYQQLDTIFKQHLEKTGQKCLDISLIEQHFPEFQFIGKTALDKWLKHLVDNGLLLKPNARKKQFTLPKAQVEFE
ncbi:MAG: DNA-processing protein DprA [Shewanella sp.]|nr:DNA-processing protein DprA [Shewanella sp.]